MHKLIFIAGVHLFSCNHTYAPGFEKEKRGILLLEEKQREWHFTKNRIALIEKPSGDFLSISKGINDKPSHQK